MKFGEMPWVDKDIDMDQDEGLACMGAFDCKTCDGGSSF